MYIQKLCISRGYYAAVIAVLLSPVLILFPRPDLEATSVRDPEQRDEEKTLESENKLLAAFIDVDAIDDNAPEVHYLTEKYGFSADKAKQDIARQPAMIALIEQFEQRNPDTFGGAWFSHKEGGRLHLAATQWTEDDEVFVLKKMPGAEDLIEFETVKNTLDKLLGAYDQAVEERSALRARGYPRYELSLHIELNALTVHSDELTAVQREALRARYAPVTVTFAPGEPLDEPACHVNSWTCDPPLRGGIRSERETSTSDFGLRATGGFVARNSAGAWYLIASGHALQGPGPNRSVFQPIHERGECPKFVRGRCRVGGLPREGVVVSGRVDAGRIFIGSPGSKNVDYWRPTRWVWLDRNTQAFQVRSRNTDPVKAWPHLMLCRGGGQTGTDCGEVLRTFATVTRKDGVTLTQQLRTNICAQPGDSGSPIFTRESSIPHGHPSMRAFAITGSSNYNPNPDPDDPNDKKILCGDSDFHSHASHIRYVEDQLDVTVWTN